jgi:chemotaxis protein MotB
MAKRGKKESSGGGGCPDYMMTFGDMMSLLLCFFVMLVSLSKIKEDDVFRAALESIRQAFGYTTSPSQIPGEYSNTNAMTLIERIQDEITIKNRKDGQRGEAEDQKSQIGRSSTVRTIRDGLKITVGGMALFENGTAVLLDEGKEELESLAERITGYKNRILIRGHTSRTPLPQGSPFENKMALAYARAMAVREFMIANDVEGIRLNVEACGDHEPKVTHAPKGFGGQQPNQRVEIIVKETMVTDAQGETQNEPGGRTIDG